MERFHKQVAVITGGADGLGKAIGFRLASEGAHVVIFDRNQQLCETCLAEYHDAGYAASYECVDVSQEEDIKNACARVAAAHERIDIMINSAGIVGPTSTVCTETETDAFDRVIAVNLRGSFLMAKYSLQIMSKQNYGRILLIASIAGKEGNPGMCPYSASKAGVIGLVKSLGKEYAEHNITVNALAPAVIQTAMVEQADPKQVQYMTEKIPMKRLGTLDECAATAAWIVSPEASFNTAFTFDLSGGRATY